MLIVIRCCLTCGVGVCVFTFVVLCRGVLVVCWLCVGGVLLCVVVCCCVLLCCVCVVCRVSCVCLLNMNSNLTWTKKRKARFILMVVVVGVLVVVGARSL